MIVNLYLLKGFNNYFNRQVKFFSNYNDYLEYVDDYFLLSDTNFNYNDGITTVHTVGSGSNSYDKAWNPDYLIEVANGTIIRRWFVIEFTRLMNGQFRIGLKRDTIADNYISVISSPCYIEKATLPNDDEFLVNNEGMKFNQIKTGEYALRDKTKCSWLVVYLNQKRDADWDNIEFKSVDSEIANIPNLEDYPELMNLLVQDGQIKENVSVKYLVQSYSPDGDRETTYFTTIAMNNYMLQSIFTARPYDTDYPYSIEVIDGGLTIWNPTFVGDYGSVITREQAYEFLKMDIRIFYRWLYGGNSDSHTLTQLKSIYNFDEGLNSDRINLLNSYDGKAFKYNGVVYYLQITDSDYEVIKDRRIDSTLESNFVHDVETFCSFYPQISKGVLAKIDENRIGLVIKKRIFNLVLNPNYSYQTTIKKDAVHNLDAAYDIICLPIGNIDIYNGSTKMFSNNNRINMAFVRALQVGGGEEDSAWGGSNIYDVQILPFCPLLNNDMIGNNVIDISKGLENNNYNLIKGNEEDLGIFFYSSSSKLNFPIDKLYDTALKEEIGVAECCKITDRKIENECDLWRLVSPNYDGMFDFNLTKIVDLNNDHLDYFNVDITYRPYSPYIHINPNFDFLYGIEYGDSRGLICGGDFSLSSVSNEWTEYMINNKNYLNAFERELDSLEVNRTIQKEQERFTQGWAIGDLLKGQLFDAPMAAAKGFMQGGTAGAIISGVSSAVNSAYSGARNISSAYKQAEWNERAYKEQRDFKIDMFNFNLDNIHARPQTITKTSAISNNFKKFPILEYYTSTEKEKTALREKLKYNGMTVMRIGAINEFISNSEERFVKGQLIRLIDFSDDSHLANDIYEEVNKGLFFVPLVSPNKEK